MKTFKFQKELDISFLQSRFGDDPFSAREVIGSFVEMAENELLLLENAFEQRRFAAFARVASRMRKGMEMVGMKSEINDVDQLRTRLAVDGASDDFERLADQLLDEIRNKSSLFRIEVQRLDSHLESTSH